jgi:tetratricopeptide (TPR) repeat protein
MRYSFFILSIFIVVFPGCKNSGTAITKASDYERYMHFVSADSMPSLKHINIDIDFWSKRLVKNPGDAVAKVSLAGLYSARFKTGGDINDIHTSDSLFLEANNLFKTSTSSVYRSLAANCITQHKFQQAKLYLDTALEMGDDKYLTYLMRCDVGMELGYLDLAEQSLKHISGKDNFDYLIREAKLLDHKGDLDGAIKKIELAVKKAAESGKDALILWAVSNLGDMYGHANRFKESYQCYLDVLALKPDYLYALKGIAWLAFSHDRNAVEAKRILNYLSKIHPVPDYDLLLAEIAGYENDNTTKQDLLSKFIAEAGDQRYGDMYNKYVFNLMIDESKNFDKALQLAEREVNNRPTAQSYDLLAWAYHNLGRKEDALKIARAHVENMNHEPDALYHLGMIYGGAGNKKKAKYYLQEAKNSAFELGPDFAVRINNDLHEIK